MENLILKSACPTAYEIREELQEMVIKELQGPAGGSDEELINDDPKNRYLVGMLAPKNQYINRSEYSEIGVPSNENSEDGKDDFSAPTANTFYPSSFGLTFCVDTSAEYIQINAGWGAYERIDSDLINEKGNPKKIWKRRQITGKSLPINIKRQKSIFNVIHDEFPDVYIKGIVREGDGIFVITLFLVNDQEESSKLKSAFWLFQAKLEVTDPDGSAIFMKRQLLKKEGKLDKLDYDEGMAMEMIYRNKVEFAVGHGISVHSDVSPDDPNRAFKITTTAIPVYEVPKTTPPTKDEIPGMRNLILDMKELSETPSDNLASKLIPLIDSYSEWIDSQNEILKNADSLHNFREYAEASINDCMEAKERIRQGIELISNDPVAAQAFQFANKAMYLQRIQTICSGKNRRKEKFDFSDIDVPKNRSWYPFQLAFILINLPGITNLDHPDRTDPTRAIADLLWFPTGGGKTEAYLGLSAYTIALRRLQGEIEGRNGEAGIAIFMRYTLRLLTLQQFQRATALICACESIRRENESLWGLTPFRIGLWVGNRTTPNTTEQSNDFILREKSQSYNIGGASTGSSLQLTNCPWCGYEINAGRDIFVESFEKGRGRTLTYCGDPLGQCLFSRAKSDGEGLPVLVVDEEIYRLLPSMLISTVDKFAQMPWKGETQMLFGKVNGICTRHGFRSPEIDDSDSHNKTGNFPKAETIPRGDLRPPDLIIQDELHLISGPLGTMVGLYETAVDKLASWEVNGKIVRPKVILSTATTKRSSEQVQRVFCREVRVFPPSGLDIEDNFFSKQREPGEENPGRKYMGICAPGKKHKTVLIKTYVAYLAASKELFEKYGEVADPWMTLVGYFNTIRELGGMRRLIDDIIRNQLKSMDTRGFAKRFISVGSIDELTSRKDATEIPRILDRMETTFKTKNETKDKEKTPLDILLSTNMISVGVDVQRLGLMIVAGQPKYTAEYIQASSRVGRKFPGLVCTIYNWAKPRDLTHYECFEYYHSTFYKHVEALSVTPFAPRAIDRGLTALLVSLIRLSGEEFNSNKKAGEIDGNHPYVKEAIKYISERAGYISYSSHLQESIGQELKDRLDKWKAMANASGGSILGYKEERDGRTRGLLNPAGKQNWDDFTCLTSLRDVESPVNLVMDNEDNIDSISESVPINVMTNIPEDEDE